jgi:predicted DNA binding CopG/RHH family protein
MSKNLKKIPKFKSETAEQKFWAENESTDFIDWSGGQRVSFPNLKPSLKSISIRLPEAMIEQLKVIANKKDVPYQSLVKIYLSEKLKEELSAQRSRRREGDAGAV